MPESKAITNLFFLRKQDTKTAAKATMVNEEALLVERICAGEQDAFNDFYKKLSPLVHGIVLARVPRNEVEDIVQEVFISAFYNMSKLRDKNAVGPWIARIARNRSVEFYRRNKPTEQIPENLVRRDGPKAEAHEILETIRDMSKTYRETLILRLVEGMTGPEIAQKLGMTHSSVRVNLSRGMRILRGKLGIKKD